MNRIKWGVLGTAGIARGCTIPGMKKADNCELYAIAGRDLAKAEAFKSEFGFEKAYGDYDSLLADENVQAVYIPLPNNLHYEWVMRAINAGKHVLCEKPLVPTGEQARELFEAARAKGVILMEAFAYLHSPYVTALCEEVASGRIGDIRYIESAFVTQGYDMSNIRMYKENYGGVMYDLGCYCLSLVLRLMGKKPTEIKGMADYTDEGVDAYSAAYLKFGNEQYASIRCGMVLGRDRNGRYDSTYIHGSKGYIKSNVEYNQQGDLKYSICIDGVTTVKTVLARDNYCLEVENLGRAIAGIEPQHVTPEFSMLEAKVLEDVARAIGYFD